MKSLSSAFLSVLSPSSSWGGSHDQFQRQETGSRGVIYRGGLEARPAWVGLIHVTHAPGLRLVWMCAHFTLGWVQ